jgi:hypothetical protein
VTRGPTAFYEHTSLVRTMVTSGPTAPCLTTQRGGKRVAADARSSKGSQEVSPLAKAESRIDKRSVTTFTTFTGPGESEVDPDEGEVSPPSGETGETGETPRTYAANASDGGETCGETLDESHTGAEEQEAKADAIERAGRVRGRVRLAEAGLARRTVGASGEAGGGQVLEP